MSFLLKAPGLFPAQVNALEKGGFTAMSPSGLAVLGDSLFANGYVYAGSILWSDTAQSIASALNIALGGPWDLLCDGSISGTTSSQWISNASQLDAVIASNALTVFVSFPTNDPDLIGSYATTISNLDTIFTALRNAGKNIVVSNAGTKAAWTAASLALAMQISDYIVMQASLYGWPIFDQRNFSFDPSTGRGSTALYLTDSGTYAHLNYYGVSTVAQKSLNNFARIPARPVNVMNAVTQGIFNGSMLGDTLGYPDGWNAYANGVPSAASVAKVAIPNSVRSLVRFTGTSDATASCRQGMVTQTIRINEARVNSVAYALGKRSIGSFGDQWVCTAAGTTASSQPAAMGVASTLGQTVLDGTVTWTRYANITAGVSKLTLRLEFDFSGITSGKGATPVILCNFNGSSLPYSGIRVNSPSQPAETAQNWDYAKTRRPVLSSPYEVLIPSTATGFTIYVYQQWAEALVTSTFDVYGLEVRVS